MDSNDGKTLIIARSESRDIEWEKFILRKQITKRLLTLFSFACIFELVVLSSMAIFLLINGHTGYGVIAVAFLLVRVVVNIGKLFRTLGE